jgi:O-glycosyl hydrolase
MMKLFYIYLISIILIYPVHADAQVVLANFEDNTSGDLIINHDSYNANLFTQAPGIYANPDMDGINTSEKCFGAVNVANAGWWRNYVELQLETPVTITSGNRMFSFLVYRSIQPKEMRLGINGYEEAEQVYFDKTIRDGAWDRVIIDLGTTHLNQTIESVWIIFSCNWYEPNSGWDEAAYYFDDFTLSSTFLPEVKVVIHPGEVYQTMEDFGASDAWTADPIGKYWGEAEKEFIAEKLFSQEFASNGNPKGIGLSTWRFNLGAGTAEQDTLSGLMDFTRRTECFLKEDGTYDWTKQSGQMYFVEKAKEYGCENLVLFSNSPPVYYTKNGKGFADWGAYPRPSNLQDDNYDEFAEFMATTAGYFEDQGFNVTISPVNEPQYEWNGDEEGYGSQEGCPWSNSGINKLAVELNKSLEASNQGTKIDLAEAGSWIELYGGSTHASNQIYEFFDPSSANYIGNLSHVDNSISGHSYWTFLTNSTLKSVRTAVKNAARPYGLKVHQTEWSFLDEPPSEETGFAASYEDASYMDFGLFLGKMIYCDIAFANASSWSFWTALSPEVYGHKTRFLLLRYTPSDGAGGYNPYASIMNGGMVEDTPNLWALGNYSLFIRPGFKRIRIDGASEMNNLLGTAYISPDGSQIVTVYVNMFTSYRKIKIRFQGMEGKAVKIRKYITNASINLTRDQLLNEDNVDDVLALLPRSITTVVYDIDTSVTSINRDGLAGQALKVFPNPVKKGNEVNIILPDKMYGSASKQLCILSLDGDLLNRQSFYTNGNQLSIVLHNRINSGIYIISVSDRKQNFHQKLLVF